jgi:signal transduction histidine kinase
MATIAAPAIATARSGRGLLRAATVATVGAVACALTAAGIGLGDAAGIDAWTLVRAAMVGSYVAVGTYTWWRRPGSRFGALLAETGLLFAVASLNASTDELAHTIGRIALAVVVLYLAYGFLCFPRDRLETAVERRLIGTFTVAAAALWLVTLPLVETLPASGPIVDCGSRCPDNALQLVDTPDAVSTALGFAVNGVTALALVGVIVLLVDKARSPAVLRRRLVLPVLGSAIALAAAYSAYTVLRQLDVPGLTGLKVAGAAAALAIPLAMLVGQVRGRVFAATSLVALVGRVGGEPVTAARVEGLLRDALGDPQLRFALRRPGNGYVDVEGHAVELPVGRRDIGVTPVLRNGEPVAALVHDVALDEGSGITSGLAATALMLLENARLVTELRDSRERIVVSGQQERLRLERNLHDGAQQRLFSIQLKLTAARARARDPQLARALDELTADTAATVDELRSLAHGLYPTVLRERGLVDALRAAARGAAVPVRVVDGGVERSAPSIEEAVYFCVLEAIQNTAKHGGRGVRATVRLEREGRELRFAVTDDGAGFDPVLRGDGIGLVSMRDRIGAAGGTLDVVSRPGEGTAVVGVVPDPELIVRSG